MTNVIKDSVATYVEFDAKTGNLISLTSYPSSENFIEVDFEKVKGLANGNEKFKHYKVQFNPTSLIYELVNVYDETQYEYNVNNSLHKVKNTSDADIIVVKNYITKQWYIRYGKLFAKTIKQNNVTLNAVKNFSIVKQNDPFQLHRCLKFNLADNFPLQFDKNDAIIQEFDVYTNKLFNSYGVEIVKN